MKRIFTFGIAAALAGLLGTEAFAANSKTGTSAAQFLKMSVSARGSGLGEAYSTVADGADGLYWNPAGLGFLKYKAVSLMRAQYLENFNYNFAAYAHPLASMGTLGIGVQYFSSNDTDRVDAFGDNAGSFRLSDLAVTLGYAKSIDTEALGRFGFGVSGKMIRSEIIESAQTAAMDAGMIWEGIENLRLGAAAQNIGGSLKFKNDSDPLPLNFKIGSSYVLEKSFLFALDVNLPNDGDPNAGFGAEYRTNPRRTFKYAARGGYNTRNLSGLDGLSGVGLGLGAGYRKVWLDFSWSPFASLGSVYRVSLSFLFGQKNSQY